MIPSRTTAYYGKEYRLVYSSTSRKKANIYADVLNKIFGDYNYGKTRKTIQNLRNLIFIDHVQRNERVIHAVYVKHPYDELVRKINNKNPRSSR